MYEVKELKHVVYGKNERENLTANIFLPVGKKDIPVVICLHGGGWRFGNNYTYYEWCRYLAENGICGVSLGFRLSHGTFPGYPGVLDDVEDAMNFMVSKANEWDLDPYKMGLVGDSTGAHMAFMAAFRHEYSSLRVRCIVGAYGVYDVLKWANYCYRRWPDHDNGVIHFLGKDVVRDKKAYMDASPYYIIDEVCKNIPQFKPKVMLLWGEQDSYVNCEEQSVPFLEKLKENNISVESYPIPDVAHLWMPRDIIADEINPMDQYPLSKYAPKVLEFLKKEFDKPHGKEQDFSIPYERRAAYTVTAYNEKNPREK